MNPLLTASGTRSRLISMKSLFLILAFVPSLALADLGDTLAQSALKYGNPQPTGNAHILAYVHGQWRVWQTYNAAGVCVIADFSRLDRGPLTGEECSDLDRANLPPGLVRRPGFRWDQVKWPDNSENRYTVSFQYDPADDPDSRFQLLMGQFRDAQGWYYYRMYLSAAGIQMIKVLR